MCTAKKRSPGGCLAVVSTPHHLSLLHHIAYATKFQSNRKEEALISNTVWSGAGLACVAMPAAGARCVRLMHQTTRTLTACCHGSLLHLLPCLPLLVCVDMTHVHAIWPCGALPSVKRT
jgi:hypothetical protein